MSIRTCQRCTANNKSGTRCKRQTCQTDLCWTHLKSLLGLKISQSNIRDAGLGLYAMKEFPLNANINSYTGIVTDHEIEGPYVLKINNHYYIDAKHTNSGASRFANDCRHRNRVNGECSSNNAKFSWDNRNRRANLKAMRNIRPNQEIFVPYSRAYWEP